MTPKHFATPADLRRWFAAHHQSSAELWAGFYKKGTGKPSITWPESVDEALCVGWIDGIRKSVDDESYMIRFTPRRPGSTWSAVNVRRAEALVAEGRMLPAGLAAFGARTAKKTGIYSYERARLQLPDAYEKKLRSNAAAWAFFQNESPWYRKTATYWIVSAKGEETRLRRLERLIADSRAGQRIGPMRRPEKPAKAAKPAKTVRAAKPAKPAKPRKAARAPKR